MLLGSSGSGEEISAWVRASSLVKKSAPGFVLRRGLVKKSACSSYFAVGVAGFVGACARLLVDLARRCCWVRLLGSSPGFISTWLRLGSCFAWVLRLECFAWKLIVWTWSW
nr:hypothetical protein CFP56_77460 [Quercus suber]